VRLTLGVSHYFAQCCASSPLHHSDDLGLLLARSAFGLLAGFLARAAFFAGARLPLVLAASGSSLLVFSESIVFCDQWFTR
jgi:hypothetical protein